jgi:DNA-binding HxlR family transcriptional regulator
MTSIADKQHNKKKGVKKSCFCSTTTTLDHIGEKKKHVIWEWLQEPQKEKLGQQRQ